MLDHCIVMPAIHFKNTRDCVTSMSEEMCERVILIDNTEDGLIHKAMGPGVHRSEWSNGENLGVARSWNHGLRYAFGSGASFATLCSSSMRFGLDGGAALLRTADMAVSQKQWPCGFESMHGWHLFTMGRKTWETVGEFDERFTPAYYEDNDYIWRMRVANILEPRGEYFEHGVSTSDPTYGTFAGDWQHRDDGDVACEHFEDFSVRKIPWIGALQYELFEEAHAIKNCGIEVNYAALSEYYELKWGGQPGHETSTSPLVEAVRQ